jgi:hypothetical protein
MVALPELCYEVLDELHAEFRRFHDATTPCFRVFLCGVLTHWNIVCVNHVPGAPLEVVLSDSRNEPSLRLAVHAAIRAPASPAADFQRYIDVESRRRTMNNVSLISECCSASPSARSVYTRFLHWSVRGVLRQFHTVVVDAAAAANKQQQGVSSSSTTDPADVLLCAWASQYQPPRMLRKQLAQWLHIQQHLDTGTRTALRGWLADVAARVAHVLAAAAATTTALAAKDKTRMLTLQAAVSDAAKQLK